MTARPLVLDPVDLAAPRVESVDHGAQIERTAAEYGIALTVVSRHVGPTVTRYRLQLGRGVRPEKVGSLTTPWALALSTPVRYVGPPHDVAAWVEVPNEARRVVQAGEVLDPDALDDDAPLMVPLGLGADGEPLVVPLWKLPHLLVAGATGQGKSVFVNGVLTSLIAQASPERLSLVLVDPKRVELAPYASLPHLARPVALGPEEGREALTWAVEEMDRRYVAMQGQGLRQSTERPLVVVVDELGDLIATSRKEVERQLVRLAQVGRAANVHLIVATQYPTADVVTPLIKQNLPTRVAFRVMDGTASRVVLGAGGAELLTGMGDGMVIINGQVLPKRFQAALVSEDELTRALAAWARPAAPEPAPEPYQPPAEHLAAVARADAATQQARETLAAVSEPVAAPVAPSLSVADQLRAELLGQMRARVPEVTAEVRALRAQVAEQQLTIGFLLERLATLEAPAYGRN